MPNKGNNILKFNHGENFMKAPCIFYADLDSILEKISTFHNNPNESSTVKISNHAPYGYSLFTYCSFDNTKNRLSYYRGQGSMRKFCKDLKEHATKIINCEKKEMITLNHEEHESYKNRKFCFICKKRFINDEDNKEYHKVRDHCYFIGKYRGTAHNKCSINYKISKNIPVVFHNGSIYDYHFIIRGGENAEKYVNFSVPINKKVTEINKGNNKKTKYKLKFIDSFRFMSTSLSNLIDNLSEGRHSNKCADCGSCLDYMSVKDNQWHCIS